MATGEVKYVNCVLFLQKKGKRKKEQQTKKSEKAEKADNVLGIIYLTFPSFLLPHSMGDWSTQPLALAKSQDFQGFISLSLNVV